jgi:hypothetical protein
LKVAVADSTCLIGLERIQRWDILPQIFSTILIPPAVQSEVGISEDWVIVRSPKNLALVAMLNSQIDRGESEAVALATELDDCVVILDDLSARRAAQRLNLKVIGTVRVLIKAKQNGVIASVKPLLLSLTAADFRISEALIQKALQIAGEQ